MPKILKTQKTKKDSGKCIACRGTGKASNGSTCYPCNGKGTRVVPQR